MSESGRAHDHWVNNVSFIWVWTLEEKEREKHQDP